MFNIFTNYTTLLDIFSILCLIYIFNTLLLLLANEVSIISTYLNFKESGSNNLYKYRTYINTITTFKKNIYFNLIFFKL